MNYVFRNGLICVVTGSEELDFEHYGKASTWNVQLHINNSFRLIFCFHFMYENKLLLIFV